MSQAISHYRIIRKLGAGGMGEVYLAEDTKLARKVAIKLLLPKSAGDEQARKRLIREARAAARLDHPNICAIHEVGEEANGTFIIMQYVEGETLASIIRKRHLELRESLDIAMQILSGLSEAHSHGVIHRDIKPQNIIVTSRGQVKVLDFGLAKTVNRDQPIGSEAETYSILTEVGVVVGTVGYMSPEQARGARLDARSDLFSLGSLLYECLAGQPAFSGTNLIDICGQVIHVHPPPPSKLNPDVPAELDRITLKALAKDADARFQSAGELIEDLRCVRATSRVEEQVQGEPVALEPTLPRRSAFAIISNLLRKRSPLAATAMIVSVIALAGFLVIPRFWRAAPHRPRAEAVQFYERGTTAIRDGAYFQASKALERAISLDDKFALAHARLAEAWTELDYSDRAKDELLRVSTLVPDRSQLPPLEALYVRAITDMVTREFGAAIESYRRIAEQVPEPEKPLAYLDLGRAYEKNEDVRKAIESYGEATRRDSQYAAAFLRLGILYGRQQDLESAGEAFDKAQELYDDLSNQEGAAEALYQRGSLLYKVGKIAEARMFLVKALGISEPTGNKYQLIRTQLQLSRVAGSEGNIRQAREYANEAINTARSDSIENLTTQGLIDLGYAFLLRNELSIAEEYFKQALDFAQKNKGLRNEARALLMLANLRMQQDDADGARRYLEQAIPFYQRGGYSKETWQALYLLGHANDLKGDYGDALDAFNQQLELAQKWGDQSQIALSHEGIGTVLSHQELYREALSHFDECYTLYNSLGKQLNAGYASLNRGDMLWHLGYYKEAEAALNQAASVAEGPEGGYKQLAGRIYLTKAHLTLSQQRLLEAEAFGRHAMGNSQSEHSTVEAKSIVGLARSLSGQRRQGKLLCQEAVERAKRIGDPRLVDSTLLALAETLLLSGDAKNSLTTALQAQAGLARAGRRDSEWKACLIVGLAGQLQADSSIAREYVLRAESLMASLKQMWGAETFGRYAARADIAFYSKRLNDVSAKTRHIGS